MVVKKVKHTLEKLMYSHPLRLLFDGLSVCGIQIQLYYSIKFATDCKGIDFKPGWKNEYTLTMPSKEEVEDVIELESQIMIRKILLNHYQTSDIVYALLKNGKIVCISFFNSNQSLLTRKPLQGNEVYINYMHTLFGHRGKNLSQYLISFADRELLNRGKETVIGHVSYFNTPSRRALLKIVSSTTSLYLCYNLFGLWHKTLKVREYN